MLEKRTYQLWIIGDCLQLVVDAFLQFLALVHQFAHNRARPQPKIKTILQRMLAIDSVKDLALPNRRELGRAARTLARGQRALATSSPADLSKLFVGRGTAQAVARHDARHILSFEEAVHRHQAYGFLGLPIMSTSVSFHDRLEFSYGH
jgi:hypothetical protein